MGDHAGWQDYAGEEEVRDAVDEDWSWLPRTATKDAGAVQEGAHCYNEDEEFFEDDEAGQQFELEYSTTWDPSQPVEVEAGPVISRSASTGRHQVVLVEDESKSSKSSKDDDDLKLKSEAKKKKKEKKEKKKKKDKKERSARRPYKDLEESPLDASLDPGYVYRYQVTETVSHPEYLRDQSISVVTSWMKDAALEEVPHDASYHDYAPPYRPAPGPDMGAPYPRQSYSAPAHQSQFDSWESQEKTLPTEWDHREYNDGSSSNSSHDQDRQLTVYDQDRQLTVCDQDRQLNVYDPSPTNDAIPEIYRPDSTSLGNALKNFKKRAAGFASVSRSAAIVAAKVLKAKSIEFKDMAGPVMAPLVVAVLEESKQQLMGPDPEEQPAARGRGVGSGRGRGRGRGRGPGAGGPPAVRPMARLAMYPGGPVGTRPVMQPGIRPGMIRPGMPRPGIGGPGTVRPGTFRPGVPRPGMMRPGMGPPGAMAAGRGRGQLTPYRAPQRMDEY